jgi:hypothetical protein
MKFHYININIKAQCDESLYTLTTNTLYPYNLIKDPPVTTNPLITSIISGATDEDKCG